MPWDAAGQWLEVLSRVLTLLDVHHHIVAGKSPAAADLPLCFPLYIRLVGLVRLLSSWHCTADGNIQRGDQDRISFLSQVRNKPLEPLWTSMDSQHSWPADRVLYMNDVLACAGDFVRLMLNPADMVCGLDYWQRDKVAS